MFYYKYLNLKLKCKMLTRAIRICDTDPVLLILGHFPAHGRDIFWPGAGERVRPAVRVV